MTGTPTLSVVMANHNGAAHLEAALRSVLAQSFGDLEIVLADDCSTDGSVAIAEEVARSDDRLHILRASANGGPGAARNRALAEARGTWVAIVDADDLILPDRFDILLAAAASGNADIIADDLRMFADEGGADLGAFLGLSGGIMDVSAEDFLRSELPGSDMPPLGYLKPVIRRQAMGTLSYREDLRVGEDHDLLFRLLLSGARMRVVPGAHYRYRRRAGSTSHRLRAPDIHAMIAAQDALAKRHDISDDVRRLLQLRRRNLCREWRFAQLVARLKGRDALGALGLVLRDPPLLKPLARAAREHFARKETSLAR